MAKPKERRIEQEIQRTSYTRKVTEIEKTCHVCGTTFWGAKISRYCSRVCQNKANYERHAEQYRQARVESYRRQKEQPAEK